MLNVGLLNHLHFFLFFSFFCSTSVTSCGSDGKVSACNAGDLSLIPGSGRSPGEGNGSPLQYPCLENPMDRGAWWATVHWVAESDTTKGPHFSVTSISLSSSSLICSSISSHLLFVASSGFFIATVVFLISDSSLYFLTLC